MKVLIIPMLAVMTWAAFMTVIVHTLPLGYKETRPAYRVGGTAP